MLVWKATGVPNPNGGVGTYTEKSNMTLSGQPNDYLFLTAAVTTQAAGLGGLGAGHGEITGGTGKYANAKGQMTELCLQVSQMNLIYIYF